MLLNDSMLVLGYIIALLFAVFLINLEFLLSHTVHVDKGFILLLFIFVT